MNKTVDPTRLVLPDNPVEWLKIPEEILKQLEPDSRGILTRDQKRLVDKIVSSRWFLVKNETRSRCGNCRAGSIPGAIHDYLTLGCVELPFHGWNELVLVMDQYDPEIRERVMSAMKPGTIVPINTVTAMRYVSKLRGKGYNLYPALAIR